MRYAGRTGYGSLNTRQTSVAFNKKKTTILCQDATDKKIIWKKIMEKVRYYNGFFCIHMWEIYSWKVQNIDGILYANVMKIWLIYY